MMWLPEDSDFDMRLEVKGGIIRRSCRSPVAMGTRNEQTWPDQTAIHDHY
jgi:hypothetical protein